VAVNPAGDICTKNVAVIGVGGESASSYLPAMRMMARNLDRLPVDRILTHRLPLDAAAEALAVSQTGAAVKVVFQPNG
jgi:threonine dehydrogenase-like Zn-dependent dehydrogenase